VARSRQLNANPLGELDLLALNNAFVTAQSKKAHDDAD
jgi:hypothetical protein